MDVVTGALRGAHALRPARSKAGRRDRHPPRVQPRRPPAGGTSAVTSPLRGRSHSRRHSAGLRTAYFADPALAPEGPPASAAAPLFFSSFFGSSFFSGSRGSRPGAHDRLYAVTAAHVLDWTRYSGIASSSLSFCVCQPNW